MGGDLGGSGIDVSEAGFGCWAIGGPVTLDGRPDGWGTADDDESVAALRRGMELGVTFFDTADVYGAGHSERVLGRALAGHRDEVVIATKFGYTFDTGQRAITGEDATPAYIHRACRESLRRLGTDRIDLCQLHLGELSAAQAQEVAGTLDGLVAGGLGRAYGWSTDDSQRATAFAGAAHCAAIQHELNGLVSRTAPGHCALLIAASSRPRDRPGRPGGSTRQGNGVERSRAGGVGEHAVVVLRWAIRNQRLSPSRRGCRGAEAEREFHHPRPMVHAGFEVPGRGGHAERGQPVVQAGDGAQADGRRPVLPWFTGHLARGGAGGGDLGREADHGVEDVGVDGPAG
jgi:hypothetical protein